MGKPKPEELQQLKDAIAHKAGEGRDVGVLNRILGIGEEQAKKPAGQT